MSMSPQSAFFISTTRALAYSQAPIISPKYTRSRRSMTPLLMAWKWVRKLIDAMPSTIACGAQALKASRTSG
ncbi:hypothetical protein [Pseudofulvimonas gallinarii]|uniref:hypothetical protein n=1 Tax=Pseudofulvimonas gallinarii TaxID=634155 RepID=UPI0030B8E7AD